MTISFHRIFFQIYLQFNFILNLFADKPPILKEMIRNIESTHWPLQAGYPGLTIENLNEYVSLFSHCLVNIQNYQGIEIIGIKSPVRITRFDVAYLKPCWDPSNPIRMDRVFFGKSKQNCFNYTKSLASNYSDQSFNLRWYCTAHFDLFFPEPVDAPHIVYQSQEFDPYYKRDLFDVSPDYFDVDSFRDNWSKILLI